MKTLKKTLCLVLAVVMAVGVLVLPANAATFDDADEITHDEAVAVLSGLSIVSGNGAGSFDPDKPFTRAEAAALLAQVVLTPEKAKLLTESKVVFTDVPADHYANKFITWAVENNLIHGVGDNKYEPDRKLTGLELAALMLEVLGETLDSANLQNFVALNTDKYGLDDEITGYVSTSVITRDDAVQMMFNAMKYDPDGQTRYQLVDKKSGDVYGTFDSKTDAAVYRQLLGLKDDADIKDVTTGTSNILYKTYNTVKNTSDTDVFGRPSTTWKQNVGTDKETEFYAKQNTAAVTYENKEVSLETVAKDLKLGDSITAKRFENGKRKDFLGNDYTQDGNAGTVNKGDVNGKWTKKFGGYGSTVEVYKEDDVYCIYVTYPVVGVVDEATLKAAKDGKITLGGIKIPAEGLEKNNVVLYTGNTVSGEVADYEVITPVVGKVTAKGTTADPFIRVEGGSKQYFAANPSGDITSYNDEGINYSTTYDIYTANGYIVYMVEHEDGPAPESTKNYTYIHAYEEQPATGGLLSNSGAAAKAQIVNLETGAVSTVDVAIAQSGADWYIADKDNKAVVEEGNKLTEKKTDRYKGFVTYELTDDGKYVFAEVEDINVTTLAGQAKITAGETKYASTNTKLVYLEYSKADNAYKPHVYNGYKSFVAANVTKAGCIDAVDGKVVAVYVYADTAPAGAEVDKTPDTKAVFMGATESNKDGTYYTFVIDGVAKDYFVKNADITDNGDIQVKSATAKTPFAVKLDGDTLLSAKPITMSGDNATIEKLAKTGIHLEDGYIVNGESVYYLSSDCIIYDATGSEISVVDSITYPDGKTTAKVHLVAVGAGTAAKEIEMIVIVSFDA